MLNLKKYLIKDNWQFYYIGSCLLSFACMIWDYQDEFYASAVWMGILLGLNIGAMFYYNMTKRLNAVRQKLDKEQQELIHSMFSDMNKQHILLIQQQKIIDGLEEKL